MKKIYATPILLAIAALIGACSGMPTTTSLLDQARGDYMAAQRNPNVARYAPLEMKQAGEAMEHANAAANDKDSVEKVDKLAYLAKQKIALTQEKASQKLSEADVASAGKERSQMLLNQRTNEADEAKASAERATASAQRATAAAQLAQGETAEAERKTREAQSHATQLQAQLNELAAKQTERGMVVTMGDVLFGTDIARLSPEGMRTAQKLADMLQQNPQRTVLVEGFTDSTGAPSHNQELSERRATAVRSALQEMGISRERVAVRGFGPAYPVAANDTAPNRQLNRRVEIVISDASGKIAQR
jgi:outer membrane protein OmpA-like peptidoglycan-associated protein